MNQRDVRKLLMPDISFVLTSTPGWAVPLQFSDDATLWSMKDGPSLCRRIDDEDE